MIRALLLLLLLSTPASANVVVCMVTETPLGWAAKTGEHVIATMEMTMGENTSTPLALMADDQGKWSLIFRGANGMTCMLAVGTGAVLVPYKPGVEN